MPNIGAQKEIVLKEKIKSILKKEKSPYRKNEPDIKKQTDKDNKLPLLCTECDKELNIFWLTDKASDKKAVKENFNNCKETGKFQGHYCSKMFISGIYTQKILKKKK